MCHASLAPCDWGMAHESVINVNHVTIAQLDCVSSLLPLHSLSHRDVFASTASAHDWWQGTPARLLPRSAVGSEAIVSAVVVRQVVMAALQRGPRPCLLHVLRVSLRTRIITCCLLLAWRRHSFQLEVSALWCIKTYLCSTVSQQHLNHLILLHIHKSHVTSVVLYNIASWVYTIPAILYNSLFHILLPLTTLQ